MKNKTPDKEKEIVKGIMDRFKASEQYQAPFRKQWDLDLKNWECILDNLTKLKAAKRSHLYIPYSFALVEWIIESIVCNVESAHPLVKLIPTRKTEPIVALRNEILLDYQLQMCKIQEEWEDAVRQLIMHGTGVLFVSWDKNKSDYSGLEVDWMDIFNFYPDSKASSWRKAEWCIRRSERSLDYLLKKEEKKYYKNITKLKEKLKETMTWRAERETTIGAGVKLLPSGEYMVEVLDYWNKYTNKWQAIAAREHLIKDDVNIFNHKELPFALALNYRRPGILYGKGELEVLEDQQHELNAMRNLRRDQEKLTVKRLLKVTKSSHIAPKEIEEWQSGGVIWVNRQDDIDSMGYQPLPSEAYMAPQEVKVEMQDAVGAQDYARGVTPPRQELATSMILLQRAAQARMGYKLRAVGTLLTEVARLAVVNNLQFMDDEVPGSILGEKVVDETLGTTTPILKEDLAGEFDYRPQLHTVIMDKAEKRQTAIMLYRELKNDPFINPQERTQQLLEAFEISNPEAWILEQPIQLPGVGGGGPGVGGGGPFKGVGQGEPENEPGVQNEAMVEALRVLSEARER